MLDGAGGATNGRPFGSVSGISGGGWPAALAVNAIHKPSVCHREVMAKPSSPTRGTFSALSGADSPKYHFGANRVKAKLVKQTSSFSGVLA